VFSLIILNKNPLSFQERGTGGEFTARVKGTIHVSGIYTDY
jgi:hypothetical protein